MTRIKTDQPLTPSLLDRLIDLEPGNTREVPKSRTQVLAELKQSVRRDLENLLNTRWRATRISEDLKELEFSLANYGIPDVSGVSLSSAAEREGSLIQTQKLGLSQQVLAHTDGDWPKPRIFQVRFPLQLVGYGYAEVVNGCVCLDG